MPTQRYWVSGAVAGNGAFAGTLLFLAQRCQVLVESHARSDEERDREVGDSD